MAYADRSSNTRRTATAVAVAVIQAGVIYAVATGLAVQFIAGPKPTKPTDTYDVPIIPMTVPQDLKKPPVQPVPKPDIREVLPLPQPSPGPTVDPYIPPTGTGPIGGTGTGTGEGTSVVLPKPQPPVFTPSLARPRNAPGSWATTNDYPARDLREGNQGVTRFKLSIGTDGKVTGCEVTASSGSASLDQTTCTRISSRARFEPATDGNGLKVTGSYSGAIRWQIPD